MESKDVEPLRIELMNRKHLQSVLVLQQSLSVFMPSWKDYDELWTSYSAQDNVFPFVALLNEKVVGHASLVIEVKIRGGNVGHIEDVVVEVSRRREGIGKALVERLVELATEKSCYRLSLECQPHNVAFYQNFQFRVSGFSMKRVMALE